MQRPAPSQRLAAQRAVWATDPERADPDDYAVHTPFARAMTWAPCTACDVQVHTLYSQYLLQGISCPGCGARLLSPPDDPSDHLARVLQREDELSRQLDADAE